MEPFMVGLPFRVEKVLLNRLARNEGEHSVVNDLCGHVGLVSRRAGCIPAGLVTG